VSELMLNALARTRTSGAPCHAPPSPSRDMHALLPKVTHTPSVSTPLCRGLTVACIAYPPQHCNILAFIPVALRSRERTERERVCVCVCVCVCVVIGCPLKPSRTMATTMTDLHTVSHNTYI
jgi:hypothetical protein